MPKQDHLQQTVKGHLDTLYDEHSDATQNRDLTGNTVTNRDTRFMKWAGQSQDGRKWTPRRSGEKVFPWPGAADSRVPLADEYVRTDTAMLMSIFWRMRTIASATESNDAKQSSHLTQFLRWQKYTQIPNIWREAKLMANWLLEQGKVVANIVWDRRMQNMRETIERAEVERALAEQQIDPAILIDPGMSEVVMMAIRGLAPALTDAALERAYKDILEKDQAEVIVKIATRDCPRVIALECGTDFFMSSGADDLQDARCCLRREVISEATLRERVFTHGWSRSWVDEVAKTQRGVRAVRTDGKILDIEDSRSKYFEVWHAYRTLSDAEGVPGIYYTVYVPSLLPHRGKVDKGLVGYHYLLNYEHGMKPFVYMERETTRRNLMESRGVGEIAHTWQEAIKTEVDSQRDRASITTNPPHKFPKGEPPPHWGPGAAVGVFPGEEYGWFDTPRFDRGTGDVVEMVRSMADRYFGRRLSDGSNATESQVLTEDLAITWMRGWVEIDTQILKLDQQWMPDEIYYRVIGAREAETIHLNKTEIQGNFDIQIGFAAQMLNPEMWEQWIKLIQILTANDPQGRLDYAEILSFICELADPNLAERIVKSGGKVTLDEIEDERQALSQIMGGFDVEIKPGTQDHGMRLQYIQQALEANPLLRDAVEKNETVRGLVDKRMKQHQHQLQQRQNAVIGRLGA